jgi:hypothetical protein
MRRPVEGTVSPMAVSPVCLLYPRIMLDTEIFGFELRSWTGAGTKRAQIGYAFFQRSAPPRRKPPGASPVDQVEPEELSLLP